MAFLTAEDGRLNTQELYKEVAQRVGIDVTQLDEKVPIGATGQRHSLLKRKIRWFQQELRRMNLIKKVDGERGLWQLTEKSKKKKPLMQALPNVGLVAISTNLGLAIWGSCNRVFPHLDTPISLVISSPPYPIQKGRAYGKVTQKDFVDWICRALEPIVKNLAPGGSICLNLSNDCFIKGSPARSTYWERLTIALEDRFELSKMDTLIWENMSKPPGPTPWASKERFQLNVAWEPILWMTNDPAKVMSNNQRVLQPHSKKHLKLIAGGGEKRDAVYSDGAYRLHKGSFGKLTDGKIPRNVIQMGHRCADAIQYRKDAARMGITPHGAPFPLKLAKFLIEFLTEPEQLVVDPFGGKLTVGKAAEELDRLWLVTEWILDYIKASIPRFAGYEGFHAHEAISWH